MADLPERVDLDFPEARGFQAPAVGRIWSRYGRRGSRDHNGIDIDVNLGQPIYSAFDGVVRLSKWNSGGFGHIVIVRHANGLETYYAHLSKRTVAAGDMVLAGQTVGHGGRSGRASAVHLHFEARYCDQSFDPERIIDFSTGELRGRLFALRKEYFAIGSNIGDGHTADEVLDDQLIDVPPDLAMLAHPKQQIDPSIETVIESSETAPDELEKGAADAKKAVANETALKKEPVFHKIRSGDTLLALAMEYRTTVARICQLNGIQRGTTLRIGRNLRIL